MTPPPSDAEGPALPLTPLTRREFARLASMAPLACVAAACSGSDSSGPVAPGAVGVMINGSIMTVPLAQNPSLAQAGGMILIAQAQALVLRLSATEYRGMTSVCTHQSCTVSSFDGARLNCPCHGSQFSPTGAVVRGPATTPLRTFATTFDQSSGVITVTLS